MSKHFNKLTMNTKVDEVPLGRYPRPLLKRNSFISLNGEWEDGIIVPYPLESANSHFKGPVPETYTYKRTFKISSDFIKDKVLLHFGAVDAECEVAIDNVVVGFHEGGYLPFEFDITGLVTEGKEHTLTVTVTDTLDNRLSIGKQKRKRGGMWYTPVTGIWQSVWLESVPINYIEGLEITPYLDKISVNVYSEATDFFVKIFFKEVLIYEGHFDDSFFQIKVENPMLWTPDSPNLYDMEISTETDIITTYFGLRTVEIGEYKGVQRILLNGQPFFFHGVLDQGYFPEGIYTPNSEYDYEEDIRRLKELGFNTLRKHIKIEPECFYEACDRLGIVVFQDMVNNGKYKFLRDTALPTIGLQKMNDQKFKVPLATKIAFEGAMEETLINLYNHPSIVYYTIFNEGWGQFDSDIMVSIVKAMDRTRIIDATSGWFWQEDSDVDSYHVYFKEFKLPDAKPTRPVILSEFGGFSYKIMEHSFNLKKTYGYGKAKSSEELTDMIVSLYEREIIPKIPLGLSGTIYTQFTDVEDETNGFYTYDRRVCKVDKNKMLELSKKLLS